MWHNVGLTLLVFVATLLIVLLLMVCVVGILYGIYFYLNSSFYGSWWETQDPRKEIMSNLQGLKQKKTLRLRHTRSDLLASEDYLLTIAIEQTQRFL
ncbi:Small integral membrane protein 13 [Apodemus speciosus]|uniref:Small integral membrane protein 13 n=1 Tax=Apodemus speciosus TaxID=105296 RepID=A0ABQ0FFT4_APOSI